MKTGSSFSKEGEWINDIFTRGIETTYDLTFEGTF